MQIEVVELGSFSRKLQVKVPADRIAKELDQAFRRVGRQAHLKGFRKGKAPRRVLELRFGPQIMSDVAQSLIQEGYSTAIRDKGIEPVSQPQLEPYEEIKSGAEFEFAITVDVRPSVELDKTTGVDVVYPKVDVSDDEVEMWVRGRLEGQARLVEVTDRAAETGDMVLVELHAKDGDDEVATEPGTMIRTQADPYYPGVDALVVGLSVGDEKTEEITFPEDARTDAVAGKTLSVTVKVIGIQANQVPELSDEIAEELNYEGGAEGMRTAIRLEIETQKTEMARNQARANLLQALIAANPFDVPGGMVDQQLQMLLEELGRQRRARGLDPRSLNLGQAEIADLRARAEFAVKGGLILEYVCQTENLEISDDEVDARLQEMADESGQPIEAIKGFFAKDDAIDELKDRLLEEKALDWLLERANLVDSLPEAPAEEKAEAKPAKKAKKAKAEEPAAEAPAAAPAGDVDLSVLDGSIGAVKDALATGDHDAYLAELLAAEEGGKARKGAIAAINARM